METEFKKNKKAEYNKRYYDKQKERINAHYNNDMIINKIGYNDVKKQEEQKEDILEKENKDDILGEQQLEKESDKYINLIIAQKLDIEKKKFKCL